MPRKTDGEKIDEMEKVMATFAVRLDHVVDGANKLGDLKTEFALLRKDFEGLLKWKEEFKKEKEENARRMWAFGPNIVGAIVSVLLSAIVSGVVVLLTKHW